jgi:uncharacterized membrane protein YqjE
MATHHEELTVEPREPDKSLAELISTMTNDLSTLMRKEVELAKLEAKEELSGAAKAGGMLAGGALAAHLALLFLSFALAWLLDNWMPAEVAFLIVAVVYAIAAAALITAGRGRLREMNAVPEQTIETLKEDVQWAKAQRS